MGSKQIKYINKDFSDFKESLIEYAKAYYPTVYNDFSDATPGSMFVDMASYVGDVLSFYLDNQIQETFLPYAKQASNIYALSYMLGYRPKVSSAATVELEVFQTVPSVLSGGEYVPDFNYALIIDEGMRVLSNSNNSPFYITERINFSVSSSSDPTDVSILSFDGGGNPLYYVLRKKAIGVSGELRESAFTFGQPSKFSTVNINDEEIIGIVEVLDSDGNKWYEVPYLAQDTIMEGVPTTGGSVPSSYSNQVPYIAQLRKVPRRFVSRFISEKILRLEFGAGVNSYADEALVYNPDKTLGGTLDAMYKLQTAYDPANYTSTYTYGIAPSNTTLTVKYLAGGGASANVGANNINGIVSYTHKFFGGSVNAGIAAQVLDSLAVNNPSPATGGGDGDTIEEIRQNTLVQFQSQLRAVTKDDYIAIASNMPSKFGDIAKAFISKDIVTFNKTIQSNQSNIDNAAVILYILAFDVNKKLIQSSPTLKNNLKVYMDQYRMLTDSIEIRDAFIINISVDVDIVIRPNHSGREVITKCLLKLKEIFSIDRWKINQPIILGNIYSELDTVTGVQTVKNITIKNIYGENNGYSRFSYDIKAGTLNGVVYPSIDPSIFEVKYPDTDIKVRIVTLQ